MRKMNKVALICMLIEVFLCQEIAYCLSDSAALRVPLIYGNKVQIKAMQEEIGRDELLALFKQVSLGTESMGHVKKIDERLKKLREIFAALGMKCELHNLPRAYVQNTLEKGIKPTTRGGLLDLDRTHVGSVVYDLKGADHEYDVTLRKIGPIHTGIIEFANSVIEQGGFFGWNSINNINAVLIDPSDPYAWDNAKNRLDPPEALAMNGYIWRHPSWENRVKVLLGIDLSLSKKQDSEILRYIDAFADQSDYVKEGEGGYWRSKRKELATDRLRHVAYAYIWLGRFVRALQDYAGTKGQLIAKKLYKFDLTIKPERIGRLACAAKESI